MRKIKDVLRLKLDAKLSHQQIALALNVSKGVVAKYVGLAAAAGLDWPTICLLEEAALEQRLLVRAERSPVYVVPDYGRIHHELRKKGVTLMLLWEEYRAEYAAQQTWRYTQFCTHYRNFAKKLKRSMRQIHRAGEKLFIDYAGPTIGLTDGSRAHIFVAAMGASSYTFAWATLICNMLRPCNYSYFLTKNSHRKKKPESSPRFAAAIGILGTHAAGALDRLGCGVSIAKLRTKKNACNWQAFRSVKFWTC